MTLTISEIARATGLVAAGDLSLTVARPAPPEHADPGDLAMAMSESYGEALSGSPARAAVLWDGADWQALGLDAALFAPRARVALAGVTAAFDGDGPAPGIHPTALVDPAASIGADVSIGPFTVISAGAEIGAGARIGAHATIGPDCTVGTACRIADGVRLVRRTALGARCIVHANAVIGCDGFSFETPQRGAVESAKETGEVAEGTRNTGFLRIHSLGGVEIGPDVEIGAGTTIDAGTLAPTRIGAGTKIDNLVQIAHNVQIGATCLICAQVGLAGSTTVGDRVVLGGRVGVADHIDIGSDCVLAGGSLVGSKIAAGSVMMGIPAQPRQAFYEQHMALRRVPRMIRHVAEIRRHLGL